MKDPTERDPLEGFEEQLRRWASTPPSIHEDELRQMLPDRLHWRFRRPMRRRLFAAAATLVFATTGIVLMQRSTRPMPNLGTNHTVVHPVDESVVLFISKDSEPVYIVLAEAGRGDRS